VGRVDLRPESTVYRWRSREEIVSINEQTRVVTVVWPEGAPIATHRAALAIMLSLGRSDNPTPPRFPRYHGSKSWHSTTVRQREGFNSRG
jgi:hypothetical protein